MLSLDWGHIHFEKVPDDIVDLDNTLIGDPRWKNSARWFYTRAAQAGVIPGTKEPFFVIPHRASIGAKINDPRLSPEEIASGKTADKRQANTTFMWHDDVALGKPYRVVISASHTIKSKPFYQELFTSYGDTFDFTI
jgi:hypothetical protein